MRFFILYKVNAYFYNIEFFYCFLVDFHTQQDYIEDVLRRN